MSKPKAKTDTVEVIKEVPTKLNQPTLDNKHKQMLDGKHDRVPGLICINVAFYPNGLQETTYLIKDDGDDVESEMSTAMFQRYLMSKMKEKNEDREIQAAKGFAKKCAVRLLVELGTDNNTKIREIMAGNIPKAASRILSHTQEMMKTRGINNFEGIVSYWNRMPLDVKEEMNQWQKSLVPEADWVKTLQAATEKIVANQKKEAERKAAKKGLVAKQVGEVRSPLWNEPEEVAMAKPDAPPGEKPTVEEEKPKDKDGL